MKIGLDQTNNVLKSLISKLHSHLQITMNHASDSGLWINYYLDNWDVLDWQHSHISRGNGKRTYYYYQLRNISWKQLRNNLVLISRKFCKKICRNYRNLLSQKKISLNDTFTKFLPKKSSEMRVNFLN